MFHVYRTRRNAQKALERWQEICIANTKRWTEFAATVDLSQAPSDTFAAQMLMSGRRMKTSSALLESWQGYILQDLCEFFKASPVKMTELKNAHLDDLRPWEKTNKDLMPFLDQYRVPRQEHPNENAILFRDILTLTFHVTHLLPVLQNVKSRSKHMQRLQADIIRSLESILKEIRVKNLEKGFVKNSCDDIAWAIVFLDNQDLLARTWNNQVENIIDNTAHQVETFVDASTRGLVMLSANHEHMQLLNFNQQRWEAYRPFLDIQGMCWTQSGRILLDFDASHRLVTKKDRHVLTHELIHATQAAAWDGVANEVFCEGITELLTSEMLETQFSSYGGYQDYMWTLASVIAPHNKLAFLLRWNQNLHQSAKFLQEYMDEDAVMRLYTYTKKLVSDGMDANCGLDRVKKDIVRKHLEDILQTKKPMTV